MKHLRELLLRHALPFPQLLDQQACFCIIHKCLHAFSNAFIIGNRVLKVTQPPVDFLLRGHTKQLCFLPLFQRFILRVQTKVGFSAAFCASGALLSIRLSLNQQRRFLQGLLPMSFATLTFCISQDSQIFACCFFSLRPSHETANTGGFLQGSMLPAGPRTPA